MTIQIEGNEVVQTSERYAHTSTSEFGDMSVYNPAGAWTDRWMNPIETGVIPAVSQLGLGMIKIVGNNTNRTNLIFGRRVQVRTPSVSYSEGLIKARFLFQCATTTDCCLGLCAGFETQGTTPNRYQMPSAVFGLQLKTSETKGFLNVRKTGTISLPMLIFYRLYDENCVDNIWVTSAISNIDFTLINHIEFHLIYSEGTYAGVRLQIWVNGKLAEYSKYPIRDTVNNYLQGFRTYGAHPFIAISASNATSYYLYGMDVVRA